MRFPKETRAAIQSAAPHPARIAWPAGSEPKPGKLYWLQSAEDLELERERRTASPETCAELLAGINKERGPETEEDRERRVQRETEAVLAGKVKGVPRGSVSLEDAEAIARDRVGDGPRKRRRPPVRGPLAGSERIRVIDSEIQESGWKATVELYEDPDPLQHLRVKAKVPSGPDPVEGFQRSTELEPEQMKEQDSLERRREEEEALVVEHKGSVDRSLVMKAEQHLANLRRRGKRSKLAEEAVQRAKKRAAKATSETNG